MPETTPEPGPVRPERSPYLIPVMDACSNHRYRRIVFITGTQAGKSFFLECVIGHRADDDPGPIIYYAPTEGNIVKKVEPVIKAMIEQCKSLFSKHNARRSTQYVKVIGAARIYLSWMGSTTETASTSARTIIVDELDRCSENAEGSVLELAEARGEAYPDSILLITGTPVSAKVDRIQHPITGMSHWEVKTPWPEGWSPTWEQWQEGTRHEWAVPCPHCGEYFVPWSGLLEWPGKGTEDDRSADLAERHAYLLCPVNDCHIHDSHRQRMNARGRAVAPGQHVDKNGIVHGTADTELSSTYSLWVSGLCSFSAKKTYGYLAKKLYRALSTGNPEKLKPTFNTSFGEVYLDAGEAPKLEEVRANAWRYALGDVLPGYQAILCTVDVQKNRLVYVVRAWYQGMCSALVDEGILWGNTDKDEVWIALGRLLDHEYAGHAITEMGIDCGYRPDEVFAFVSKHRGKARALRGQSLDMPYRRTIQEKTSRGKTKQHGLARWEFDSDRAKKWVHSRIGRDKRLPQWWILPVDISDEYCREIVGEAWNDRKVEWEKVGENHRLDCEAMQYMLARMRHLDKGRGTTELASIMGGNDMAYPEQADAPEQETGEVSAPVPKDKPAGDDVMKRLRELQAAVDAQKAQAVPVTSSPLLSIAELAKKLNGGT